MLQNYEVDFDPWGYTVAETGESPKLDRCTQLYIATLGCACRRRGRRGGREKRAAADNQEIPVIIRNRLKSKHCTTQRQSILTAVKTSGRVGGINPAAEQNDYQPIGQSAAAVDAAPSLYILNAAAITKSHAVEHLAADLKGYQIDVAVITETHLKKKTPRSSFYSRWVCDVPSRSHRASRRRGRSLRVQ